MRPSERARRTRCGPSPWRPASTATPRAPAWSPSATPGSWSPPASRRACRRFLRGRGQGWVTAEYGMLPRATHTRGRREAAEGKQSGRSQEIQRLIGRSLRAVTDLKALGERQITLDCDVIQADGGTRTAAITGGWVALRLATRYLLERGRDRQPTRSSTTSPPSPAACRQDAPVLDLDYEEDSNAEADANFVLTGAGDIVEIQATGEKRGFTRAEFEALFSLAARASASWSSCRRQLSPSAYPAPARSGWRRRCTPAASGRGDPAPAGRRGRTRSPRADPRALTASSPRARPASAPRAKPDRRRRRPRPAGASTRRDAAGKSARRSMRIAARAR